MSKFDTGLAVAGAAKFAYEKWKHGKVPKHWRPGGRYYKNNPERVKAFEATMPRTRRMARGQHPRQVDMNPGPSTANMPDLSSDEDMAAIDTDATATPPSNNPPSNNPTPPENDGGNFVGGSTNQQVPNRTLQTFQIPSGMFVTTHPMESVYKVRTRVFQPYHGQVYTIPWESMRFCHNDTQYLPLLCGAVGWKPIGADVEIFNMRAHADIPINTASFYPINLDEVRCRYIQHNSPLTANLAPIPSEGVYDGWLNVINNQSDGVQDTELPTRWLFIGDQVNDGDQHRLLDYDEQFWASKKVVDDEMIDFHWKGDGPWRNCNELYLDMLYLTPTMFETPPGLNYQKMIMEARFDYRCGMIDPPWSSTKYWTLRTPQDQIVPAHSFKPGTPCFIHSECTPELIKRVQDVKFSRAYERNALLCQDIRTHTEQDKMFGRYSYTNAHHRIPWINISLKDDMHYEQQINRLPATPHYDNNVMKPILLDFSRFMKQDNIQEYRVYYEIRIRHTIQILRHKQDQRRNLRDLNVWPVNKYGMGGADKYGATVIYTDDTAASDRPPPSRCYNKNFKLIRYFRPFIEPIHYKDGQLPY